MRMSAPTSSARSTPSVPVATAEGSSTPDCAIDSAGIPSTRSATPTSSVMGLEAITLDHQRPIPPAPTTTARSGVCPVAASSAAFGSAITDAADRASGRVSGRRVSDDTRDRLPLCVDGAVAEPVALGVGDLHRRGLPLLGAGPHHGVGQHALDLALAVDRVLLVAGAEVEDLALAAAEGGAGAEHLSPGEGGDEHQLVGGGDVEHLAVHLLLRHDDRVGHAAGDGVGAVDGPHPLLL